MSNKVTNQQRVKQFSEKKRLKIGVSFDFEWSQQQLKGANPKHSLLDDRIRIIVEWLLVLVHLYFLLR